MEVSRTGPQGGRAGRCQTAGDCPPRVGALASPWLPNSMQIPVPGAPPTTPQKGTLGNRAPGPTQGRLGAAGSTRFTSSPFSLLSY